MKRHLSWELVDVRDSHECWEWQGDRLPKGYGRAGRRYAHRWAYETTYGPIPEGLEILHHCDNPPCCNPAHLSVGTRAENMADASRKGRLRSRLAYRTSCKHGHPLSGANVYVNARGHRICRTCVRINQARFRAKRRHA